MPSSKAFNQAYKSLNPAQKQAVDTIDGPLMVIAGPGTGKTQVLTLRIANILKKTDTQPENILGITYTESAAQNMRSRLVSFIGPLAYRLRLGTFHSVCLSIINEYPDYFTLPPDAAVMADLDRFKLITTLLDQGKFSLLRPAKAPTLYTRDILSLIQQLKREHISPPDYQHASAQYQRQLNALDLPKAKLEREQAQIAKNLEFAEIYQSYQQHLESSSRYDFEDMINHVVDRLQQDQSFRLELQERFHYFLIDEYQDTNSSQNTFVNLLADFWGQSANIFVVGDDEQSIFRFQGASLENILNFSQRYPRSPIISLTQNYRSQQNILDASRAFIDLNQLSLSKSLAHIDRRLVSEVQYPKLPLREVSPISPVAEADFLTTEIQALLQRGVPPGEIAIIASRHRDFTELIKLLNHHRLPYKRTSGDNLLDHPIVNQFLTLLRTIDALSQGEEYLDLFTILHYQFFHLSPADLLHISRFAHTHRLSLFSALHHPDLLTLPIDSAPVLEFINRLTTWHQQAAVTPVSTFCRLLLSDSGLLDYCTQAEDSLQLLNSLNSFIVFVTDYTQSHPNISLSEFIQDINLLTTHGLTIDATPLVQTPDAITLTTAHKAKGLEWDHVYILSLTDTNWGGRPRAALLKPPPTLFSQPLADESLEENRRLFYVALTRARQTLTLTYPQQTLSGANLRPTTPHRFLSELPQELLDKQPPPPISALPALTALLSPAQTPSANEDEIIDDILKNFSLSPSSLEDYLECPYRFKWLRLFNLQTPPNLSLSLGNAAHAALAQFNQSLKKDPAVPSLNFLLTAFKQSLNHELLPEVDHRSALTGGKAFLTAYYHFFRDQFTPPLYVERRFGTTANPVIFQGVPLSGKIDRIEADIDSPKHVKLIDYKTGRRKTKGQIEGTTQDSDGRLKRQLVFYHLLLSLDPTFSYSVSTLELDFVETPRDEKRSGRIDFTITPTELDDLKQTILTAYKGITAHKFPKTTEYSRCQRCPLLHHCWPGGTPASYN